VRVLPKNHGWAKWKDFREAHRSAQFVSRHRAQKYFKPAAAVRQLGARWRSALAILSPFALAASRDVGWWSNGVPNA
jgi:hypothetical protein